jgi:O-antigen/teichoic acid export membrane protein
MRFARSMTGPTDLINLAKISAVLSRPSQTLSSSFSILALPAAARRSGLQVQRLLREVQGLGAAPAALHAPVPHWR